ncbi:MAG: phosphoadenosine phosphosulfate reductase family protein [Coprococcus sp.]
MEKLKLTGGGNKNVALSENKKPVKASNVEELIQDCPKNQTILDNLIRAWAIINKPIYEKIVCSISGGSDSDIMLDIVWRCDKDNKVDYVWFDTGLEYQATKEHLKYLENKYGIEIVRYKGIKPIPLTCRDYGQPFMSKQASEFIQRLQKHNFQWEDDTFDNLYKKYSKCKSALEWWNNKKGNKSSFNISRNKLLKEFMIENPPMFQISNKCCDFAKKKVIHNLIHDCNYDLNIVGVRKSEGGVRAQAYKNCFDDNNDNGCDNYRPIFWYKDQDKIDYENAYGIIHSKCYTEYGLKRTGCVGCPYGKDFEYELEVVKQYEPKLYKAVNNIFKDSYEYTRKYRQFIKELESKRE